MRHARIVMALGALAAMLGGMLGQLKTTAAQATVAPRIEGDPAVHAAALREQEAAPRPGWAMAGGPLSRISVNPDAERPFGDLIEISIATQRLTAWRDGKIVHQFKVSTARPGYNTPRGRFEVLNKAQRWYSRQWQVWMPDALRFHGSYFIHALPYAPSAPNVRFGAHRLGRPDSHGCVRVGIANAKVLYDWASVGTPVWVH
ncbi:MAG: L,D-transpeptidase [Actinomycetota bacterium]